MTARKDDKPIDAGKRELLRRLAAGVFVAPVVASVPISGLPIDKAMAQIVTHGGVIVPRS